MSFDLYESKTVSHKLKTQSVNWRPSEIPSLIYRTTIGLGQLYSDIQLNQQLPSLLSNPRCYTNDEGFFETKSDLLLHKRYKLIEIIGQGASSMVYKAEDIITQQIVALKSVRQNYEIIASREKLMVDHMQYSERKHSDLPIISNLGWFSSKGHTFIVLPYFSHSLIEFISVGQGTNSVPHSAAPSTEMKLNNSPLVLIQPKPILSNRSMYPNNHAHSPYYNEGHSGIKSNQPPENIFNDYDLNNLKRIAFQLLTAIYLLHKEGIIHADIKPENCFLHFPSSSSSQLPGYGIPIGFHQPQMHSSSNPYWKRSGTTNVNAISSFKWLRQLPPNFQLKLADYSNSIHTSEIPSYFQDFNIQSAPYRAPEVLIGIPFTAGIDIWSIGMIILELCLNKEFIKSNEPKQIIQLIESKIGKFSKLRFSGGKYSHLLFESKFSHLMDSNPNKNPSSSSSSSSISSSTTNGIVGVGVGSSSSNAINKGNHELINYRLESMKTIKRLLLKSTQFEISNLQLHELVDFIGQLLTIDPTQRISSKEALQHSFLSGSFPIPYQLIVPFQLSDIQETKKKKRARNNEHATIQFQSLKSVAAPSMSSAHSAIGKSGGLSASLGIASGSVSVISSISTADFSPWKKKAGGGANPASAAATTVEIIESKALM